MHDLTLLLTRPEAASRRFLAGLDVPVGVRVVVSPLMEVVATGPLPDVTDRGLLFTSAHGVEAYLALGGLAHPAQVVGAKTAQAACDAGMRVDLIAKDADDLVARAVGPGPMIHLHGVHTRGDVAARLTARGISTTGAAIYDQPACDLSAKARTLLNQPGIVIAPLFSPRSALLWADAAQGGKAQVLFPVISRAVADTLPQGSDVHIAPHPTGEAMRAMVANLLTTDAGG